MQNIEQNKPVPTPLPSYIWLLLGYYLALFDCMKARQRCSEKWEDCWLHVFTVRSLLFNFVHLILRVVWHPEGCPFLPKKTLENISEYHFSQKKLGVASPSIAQCIYNTQKVHMKQLLHPVEPKKHPDFQPLSMEDTSKIMQRAFLTASKFESVTSVGQGSAALRKELLECLGLGFGLRGLMVQYIFSGRLAASYSSYKLKITL